ncbi:MAG: tetratricopeptide repeat protein [Elusimicrobia bacterium]|nr:tetratricopeptide repeat protein [Elusimicrobiota bacterium]
MNQKNAVWPYALLVFLVSIVVYSNTLGHGFIYGDDEHVIVKNLYLTDWKYLPNLLTENWKAGFGQVTNYYRPLHLLIFATIVHLSGAIPWPFHLFSILCHAGCGVLLFLFLRRLFPQARPWMAGAAALLWAVHPIQAEDINWANGSATMLHTFGMLASLVCFSKFLEKDEKKWWALSLLGFVAGLLSKEGVIVLPVLLLGFHWTLLRLDPAAQPNLGRMLKTHGPFWAVAALYVAARLTALNFGGTLNFYAQSNVYTGNILYRFYTLLSVLGYAFKIMIIPQGLHPERTWPVFTSFFLKPVFLSFAAITGAIAAGIWSYRKEPRVTLGIFWFFAAYAPMSNLAAKINAIFWEHWLYAPSIGIAIAILAAAVAKPWAEKAFAGMACLAVPAFGLLTYQRNWNWRDSEAYYQYTLRYEPRQAKLWTNLAMAVAEKGKNEEAIRYYQEAIRLSDTYPETRHNLAQTYLQIGRVDLAQEELKKAVALDPRFYHSYLTLAQIALNQNRPKEAIPYLETALAIYPYMPQVKQALETLKRGQARGKVP